MIKAVIFDCFGVVLTDGLKENYIYFGGDFYSDLPEIVELLHEASTGRIDSSAPGVAKMLGIPTEQWQERNDGGHKVHYDVLEYVLELKIKYKVGMLSNVGINGLNRFFKPGTLEKYFDLVVESAQIGYAKPEANAYEITADKLEVRCDECLFIDDRQEYVDGAVAVGMKAVLYDDLPKLKEDIDTILT